MDAAIAAINDTISYRHRDGRLTAGAIVVLHPFSRSMGFNPHLHILVTEGGFDRRNRFIRQKFIPFNAMRKTWQYQVLTQFKKALPENIVFSVLIDQLFKRYRKGFYVMRSIAEGIATKRSQDHEQKEDSKVRGQIYQTSSCCKHTIAPIRRKNGHILVSGS